VTPPVPADDAPRIHVVAGVLTDATGRVLLAERPMGKAFAGRWEFPGGKLNPGETPRAALERELHEELGIEVQDAEPPLDQQQLRWCATRDLPDADILEADRAIVTALRLSRWIVRDGLDAPGGADAVRVAARDGDALLDPADAPEDAVVVWSSPQRIVAARGVRGLAGCLVADAAEAYAAVRLDADFLLVPDDPGAADLAVIAALGRPWYLEARVAAPPAAKPTGRLRWT